MPNDAEFGDAKIRACRGETVCAWPEAEFRVVGVLGLATTGGDETGMIAAGALALALGLGLVALLRISRTGAGR